MKAVASKRIQLLIADDHRVLLDGLVSLLRTEPNFEIAATAENGEQVIDWLNKTEVDVCLIDISMPRPDGMELTRWIQQHKPQIKILILTTHDEEEIIAEMVQAGIAGYLLKSCTRHELVEGINRVMSGQFFFSEAVSNRIIDSYKEQKKETAEEPVTFTEREKEIVQLLAKEYTNEKIAQTLHISYRTVETHRKNMMLKTKARNLAGLLRFASNQGLIRL
ncbi:DNA-binding response regulator, NarL/FixJ family, contains REC and HTH domains [Hydrobacter penzbergensis]|jgi:DNA-binding NarL/FixJ family response regulator|uniref:DNA-binding response regulator, NarL/FixJ family, contains REC and HTH domains n=1 Tax=Hydrobacter penzbergensis TaxID=1235997 RepID=A0A8X8IHN8_9BACT|nr:response regulator transcription factor [Hydrobacter penzbergensis]MBN8719016.1 response regulator transcription factor [Sediminibacterium magnilacihabitans]PQV61382.1 DNA-binding NarL/FixJ family response regulator [Sediminibacterium magnilacihabitans]SDX41529.1 DNA-binding response regulator, NarL/FixJ family, contains REC and HTH domains [Hydrobacter penzbergensis]